MPHFAAPPLFTVPDLLTPVECRALIDWSESLGYDEAPVSLAGGPVQRPDLRNNGRVMVDDPERAAWLWARLAPSIPPTRAGLAPIGLNERLRFYRYKPGERFRWHTDGFYRQPSGERSLLTLMVYLNEVDEGGWTEFETISIYPIAGQALVFDHMLPHQGAEVIAGRKYVLRSDILYPTLG
jgi:prolyl 4-hydroxylase